MQTNRARVSMQDNGCLCASKTQARGICALLLLQRKFFARSGADNSQECTLRILEY
jgi:hypothetical protein